MCVDRAEFYKMQASEWSQHAGNRVTFTGVVLISYDTEEGIFFYHKGTHCYDWIDVMGTQVFGSEI